MATIVIDDPDAVEATGNPVPGLPSAEVVNERRSAPEPEAAPQVDDDEIPEKFRGKQLKEILKSYEDMEKLVGRQGSELGELRRTHDEVIRSVLTQRGQGQHAKPQNEAGTDDETEFFLNPKRAIEKAVEQHPLVQGLRQQQAKTVQERALGELTARHSDWKDIVQSPEFVAFVQTDPVYQMLMAQADRNFDVAAADHVLKQYKATRVAPTPSATPAPGVEDMRRAAVAASKVPAGASAPAASKGKKVYSRSEVIRKMHSDPEWYAANADDILLAYSEGRMR